jgi:multiple sugar transport system substrate-binding protein
MTLFYRSISVTLTVVVTVFLSGCEKTEIVEKPAPPPVDLVVIVIDDPLLCAAIQERWELEGDERSTLTVLNVTSDDFLRDDKSWQGDVVIFAPRQIGELTQRGWIQPLSSQELDDQNLGWLDVFPLLRQSECNWNSKTYGVTFGSPVPVLFYRHDLFAAADRSPPQTWGQYAELVKHFSEAPIGAGAGAGADTKTTVTVDGWHAAIEPLAGTAAADMLLARATGYVSHSGTLSALFDSRTMEPRIAEPPFLRAAEEMLQVVSVDMLFINAEQSVQALLEGRCAMAIGYLEPIDAFSSAVWERVSVTTLPGAGETYDRRLSRWQARDADVPHVPLLATRGRMGSIAKRTKNRRAAGNLLIALAGRTWGNQIAPASQQTAAYRSEHVGDASLWAPRGVPNSITDQYTRLQLDMLQYRTSVFVPRFRGGRRLDNALANELARAIRGEKTVEQALREAATQWEIILNEELPNTAVKEYRASQGL